MNIRAILILAAALGMLLAAGSVARATTYDVYKAVPDADKDGVRTTGAPDAGDLSCWLACAANQLAGGGWGTGATAQDRADTIYQRLADDVYGMEPSSDYHPGGYIEGAVNYWLYTYGLNPDSPEYKPAVRYTDVTVVQKGGNAGGLTREDYNAMLLDLQRCQYVAVSFKDPSHCLTLAGGDYDTGVLGSESVWHDSDSDLDGGDDSTFGNEFNAGGFDLWTLSSDPNAYNLQNAWAYVTLCPGLQKPELALRQYDVAYYGATMTVAGDPATGQWIDFDPDWRERGAMAPVYDDPEWESDTVFRVDNEARPDPWWQKEVWLLVDYTDRVADRAALEKIRLQFECPEGGLVALPPTSVQASADDGQLLFYWLLPCQPDWEKILFPDVRYSTLWDYREHDTVNVKDWDLTTYCKPVPEPVTLCGLIMGLGCLARYVRRRAG